MTLDNPSFVIEIPPILVENSDELLGEDEEILKERLWKLYSDKIRSTMQLKQVSAKSELEHAKQRLCLLDQISDIQRQFLQRKEPKTVFGFLLSGLLNLMDSEYGFIGEIKYEEDGTMYLQTHAITNIAWNTATREFYEANAEAGLKFYNLNTLFGHVMVNAEPVIANTPEKDDRGSGIPEGHPPLNHFLGIPFFEPGGNTISGMVGIANKPGGYSQEDIEFLEPFVVTCSSLIQAYAAMQENISLIDTLEEKVRERTFEIQLANERLQLANRRVVEASEAQLKNFACMSHEIRTPLNCITGLSSLLLETELTPQQTDTLSMIVTSSELLSAVVNDVLDYSKLASGKVEVDVKQTNLQGVLDAVVHSIEVKGADRNLSLKTNYDPRIPRLINTDSRRLQQILYNLLGNAIKFSKEGGVVELSVVVEDFTRGSVRTEEPVLLNSSQSHQTPTRQDTAESSCSTNSGKQPSRCPFHRPEASTADSREQGLSAGTSRCPFQRSSSKASAPTSSKLPKALRFIVKDYGKGIDKEDFRKIFKPFMQASNKTEKLYGGTGLGLAITSKLVEALGGKISVDSEVGKWSTFTVEFPFECEFADVKGYSDELNDTRLFVVNNDEGGSLSPSIIETYNLNVVELSSCAELLMLSKINGAIDPKRDYICLIHEDSYDPEAFAAFAAAAPGTTLLTFGRNYSASDGRSRGHYRSLQHVFPSNFVWSLLASKGADSGHSSADTSSRQRILNQGLSILIAEDNVINQKVLERLLRRCGVQAIDIVDNGKKAVEWVETHDYDLVLMDQQMPIMGGVEATRIITQNPEAPRVVFVTANAMGSFEREAREAGATGFLPKPFNLEKIRNFLASVTVGDQ